MSSGTRDIFDRPPAPPPDPDQGKWIPVQPLIPTKVTRDLPSLDRCVFRLNAALGEKWTEKELKEGRPVRLSSKIEDVEILRAAIAQFAASGWHVEIDEIERVARLFPRAPDRSP